MPSLHSWLLLGKLLSVLLYASGCVGTALSQHYPDRQRFAYRLAAPGFGLVWIFGISLTWQTEVALFSTWLVGTMLASLVTINGILYRAGKEERKGLVPALVILVPLGLSVALMVLRPA